MRAPIIGIIPHRILTDGQGVTTLVGFQGCPLRCKYCLNPHSIAEDFIPELMSVEELIKHLSKDDIYFRATGGGVCFTGGEPLLHTDFIQSFREKAPKGWNIYIETSLNVDIDKIKAIETIIDGWIIDIKDMNPEIYKEYTGGSNHVVLSNLQYLASKDLKEKITIRIPEIPSYNNNSDLDNSKSTLLSLGFSEEQLDLNLCYKTQKELERSHIRKGEDNTSTSGINGLKYNTEEGTYSYSYSVEGKAICQVLKEIRKCVADMGDVAYTAQKCTHRGDCSGSCPMCEEELETLKGVHLNLAFSEQARLFDTIITNLPESYRFSLNPPKRSGIKRFIITSTITQGIMMPGYNPKANSIKKLKRQGISIENISKITKLDIEDIEDILGIRDTEDFLHTEDFEDIEDFLDIEDKF